jgi:hypothetical protein
LFFESMVLGVLLGWIRGGRVKHLLSKAPEYGSLVILALFLQFALNFDASRWGLLTVGLFYIHLWSYILLFAFFALNHKLPGMLVVFLGVFLNFLVIAVNKGSMPVLAEGLRPDLLAKLLEGRDLLHSPVVPATRLVFLADIIPVPGGGKISIGDIYMNIGMFHYLQQSMQRKRIEGTRSFRHR